jgi:FAD/FMN-containing dehydrogenase
MPDRTPIEPSEVQVFQSRFAGSTLTPGDTEYDNARTVFNAMIDRRPALIARCANTADVSEAVNFARTRNLIVAIRCTGHNVCGYAVCDGGLVIDLSRMKRITIDETARKVRVEPGCTWGEVNDALQLYDLAATGGFVSVTGVSGLTLGGGLGWMLRKHGLAIDNLVSAEVVLADGRLVTASASENDELFWGIRGGGGNFGIVTSFEFRAHPAGTVFAGTVLHPAAAAASVLRRWRDFGAGLPEACTLGAMLFHFPDDPSGPPPLLGKPFVGVGGVYTGPVDEGAQVLQPLRDYGPPMVDLFQPMPYNEAQRMVDFLWPPGHHAYWKSAYVNRLTDEAIDTIAEFFSRVPSPRTVVVLEHGEGAMSRVPDSATAFAHRGWSYNLVITTAWSDPKETERNIAWARDFFAAMQPFLAKAAYVNYLSGDEGSEGLNTAYGAATLARLSTLKIEYDPSNLLCMNQNVVPARQ